MGLGGGARPSVLNYPECTGPGAAWRGGGRALPAWSGWLPSVSRLASGLPAARVLSPSLPSHVSAASESGKQKLMSRNPTGEEQRWGVGEAGCLRSWSPDAEPEAGFLSKTLISGELSEGGVREAGQK